MRSLERINPLELGPAPSYSHVVVAESPTRTIYISGQVPMDETGQVAGVGDIAAQATVVFEHVEVALRAGGAGWEHVVRVNTYLRDMSHLAQVRAVRERFFARGSLPGSTLVEVSRLFHPDFLIEIDAIAVVPV